MLWDEIKRKSFHFAGLIYVAALFWVDRSTYIVLVALFLLFVILFERKRLHSEALNDWFIKKVGFLLRENEKIHLTGIFWMGLGALLTRFLLNSPRASAVALLYLIVGDSAASLVGKSVGGPKWFHSEKRLSGSLACFICCLVIGFWLLPVSSSQRLILSAVAATLAEFGFFRINDNTLIPVAASLVFLFF